MRKFFAPTLIAVLSVFFLCVYFNFGIEASQRSVEVEYNVVADLAQQIEQLHAEIDNLRKTIQVLSDHLDDLVKGFKSPKTGLQTSAPKTGLQTPSELSLRSPKQIDREPIGDEKIPILVTQMKVAIEDPEVERVLEKLLTTKNGSPFVQSLKKQVIDWIQTPDQRAFPTPLSTKQFAWAGFLMLPGEYENPKTRSDLYPRSQ